MKIRQIRMTAAIGLAMAISAGALLAAENNERGQLSARDYKFVKEATAGGTSEVELGDLAKQKGVNQAVRDFGERMAADHKKANDELKEIIGRKGATIQESRESLGERMTKTHLEKLNGAAFDKAYASDMVRDHKKDVKDFKDAADDVKDPDVKAFAQKMIPTLEGHLRMAEDMEKSVKDTKL